MSIPERLAYSPAEAATALGKSERWVHRRIADGTVRSVKVEHSRLIPTVELERLLGISAEVTRSRQSQGLTVTITDPAVLARLGSIVAGGDAA